MKNKIISIILIVGMVMGLLNPAIVHAQEYYYDIATVYDMYELSHGKKEVIMTESLDNSLGALPSSENVAVSFSMTMPEGSGNQVRMGFLTSQESGGFGSGGYLIQFYRNQTSCIRIVTLSDPETELFYQTPSTYVSKGSTVSVEIGAVNVYSDANKTNQVAVKIYVKINGIEAASAVDTAYTTRNIGKYVMAPAATSGWMGSFTANSGCIQSRYSFDNAAVFGMSELSEGKTEATINDSYTNTLGALPSSENVAVSFTMTMPSGSPLQVRQGFLTTNGSSYADYGGYLIQYCRNGSPIVRIVELDSEERNTSVSAPFTFGSTVLVEIGTVNVYSDEEKTEQVAKEIYVKIDGTKVVKHLDKNYKSRTIGKSVSVPTATGNFTANSGFIRGWFYDTATVYNMSQLSERKTEEIIGSSYKNSLGALPSTENIAMSFLMTKPTSLQYDLKQRFLNDAANNYYSENGYYIYYHYHGKQEIRIEKGDGETLSYKSVAYDFEEGITKQIEVGVVNVYTDVEKQKKLGREVYVKINGMDVVRFLDTNLSNDDIGNYVTVPVVDGNFDTNSGKIVTTYDNAFNISIYRSNNPYTYPTKESYVFAGWYTDKELTTPVAVDVKTGIAYAKFVKKSVLSVKCQLSANVSANDETTDLRVLTSVDDLDYESVKFVVTFENVRTFTNESKTVYRTVTVIDERLDAIAYDAKTVFKNTSAEYFMAYTVLGIPREFFGTKVTVNPSWTTLDGTVVAGVAKEFTINQAIEELPEDILTKYVDSAQKVLQKTEYTGSEQVALDISMSKAETESIQLILSSNQEVSSVEVVTYDLYDGYVKLPKENIEVYWEKYLEITKKYNDNPNYSEGSFVPDALLPMKAALDYKENKIVSNENQGIWLDITTTTDTIPGFYSGRFDLIIDGEIYTHELYVKVADIDLSAVEGEVNFWSIHMRDSFAINELDSSDDIATKYFENLLRYNVQTDLPFSGEGGGQAFAQMVKKYYNYQGFSSYRFYYERSNYWEAGNIFGYVNSELLEEYVRALAKLSVEDNRDYFDKAFFSLLNIIDEPYSELAYQQVEYAYGRLHTELTNVSKKLSSEFVSHANYSFYENTIKQSIANIPLIIAESMPEVADTLENEYGLNYISHNASLGFYDTQEKRNEYKSYVESIENGDAFETEQWWYTCVSPEYPYPSNHLDDDVLGLKTLFWMQNLYEVDGHFNWAVSYYQKGSNNGVGRDPYTDGDYMGSLPMGDGYMTYPGYPYEIYGPVMSMRLAVMRDGIDDAKYMQIIRSLYEKEDVDANEYLTKLCSTIFTGTKTTNNVSTYNEVRAEIMDTVLALQEKWGKVYQNSTTKRYLLTQTQSNGDLDRFEEGSNDGNPKTLSDSEAYETIMIADFESYEEIRQMKPKNSLGTLTENKDMNFIKNGLQSLKLKVHGRESLTYNTDKSPMLEIYTSVDCSNYNEFRVCMYNAMDYDVMIQFMVNDKYANRRAFWLTPGWNDVVIDIDPVLYKELLSTDKINKFQFIFDEGDLHEEKEVVYLDAFRAVRTKEISTRLSYQIENGIINNFDEQHDLNYVLNGTYGYGSTYYVGNGLTQSVFDNSGSALRIYANPVEKIRDIADEWRVSLMRPELLVELQTGLVNAWKFNNQYKNQNVCFDLYNNGEEAVEIYVYYYQESQQVQGTKETFVVQPKETLNFKQAFSTILEAEDGKGNKWSNTTKWTGLMIGFNIPHISKGDAPVDLIIDNYRFEAK